MTQDLRREFSLGDLVLFHITAIVTVRWISFSAARGPSSIGLWALSFALFLLPAAYVVIDFSRRMPEQGGLYQWTKRTLGPFHGFVCAWCYVINNLFYFPSLLVAVAGYAAWGFGRSGLENSTSFVAWFAFLSISGVVLLNYFGLKIGKWVENIGGVSIWLPCSLLVIFGAVHYFRSGSEATFTVTGLWPDFTEFATLSAWSQICFAFTGIELASTMSGEIKNPEKTLPKSIYLACAAITAIYILGTVAVLIMVDTSQINLVTGIVQAISVIMTELGAPQLTGVVAILLTLGGLGTLGAWISGVARMPYSVGVDRYLPEVLGRTHPKYKSPYISLVMLGVISLALMGMSLAGTSVKNAYITLANACLILYFIPFTYLFVSHMVFNWRTKRKIVPLILAICGAISTVVAIVLTLIPPEGSNPYLYIGQVGGGSLGVIIIALILYRNARLKMEKAAS
jgi:glutamate:GABA antiporter